MSHRRVTGYRCSAEQRSQQGGKVFPPWSQAQLSCGQAQFWAPHVLFIPIVRKNKGHETRSKSKSKSKITDQGVQAQLLALWSRHFEAEWSKIKSNVFGCLKRHY